MGSCTFSPAVGQPYRIVQGTCILQKDRVPQPFELLLPVRRQRASINSRFVGSPGDYADHRQVFVASQCCNPPCFDGQKRRAQRGLHRAQAAALTPAPSAPSKSKAQPWQDARHGVIFSTDELVEATGKLWAWSHLVYARTVEATFDVLTLKLITIGGA